MDRPDRQRDDPLHDALSSSSRRSSSIRPITPDQPSVNINFRSPRSRANSGATPDQSPRPRRPSIRERNTSIRIRRIPSSINVSQLAQIPQGNIAPPLAPRAQAIREEEAFSGGRRRSSSEPQRYHWNPPNAEDNNLARAATREGQLPQLNDDPANPYATVRSNPERPARPSLVPPAATAGPGRLRRYSQATRSALGLNNNRSTTNVTDQSSQFDGSHEYESGLVDLLDVVDPEVSTLTTLTNVQNSLFIPDLGPIFNRRPTYTLTSRPTQIIEADTASKEEEEGEGEGRGGRPGVHRTATLDSTMTESRYAVLPHGVSLDGWTKAEKEEINDHVRHMLHSRRSAFKRGMKGFGQYVRKPLGFFVTLYAFLITAFGLAWVLFLIGWISVGSKRDYDVNVIDNVLVALFAIIGDGLAPFRAVDTYHMIYIAHYHHLTWKLRKKKALPKLEDHNDLPAIRPTDVDVEAYRNEEKQDELHHEKELTVLSLQQQQKLEHHQKKFSKSHTFYKPHETTTHHAFPLRLLVAVVVLLDCHSLLQIALGTCTWSISYHVRPFALTTVILCCSITCNITAGVLISIGDRMTRKKDVIEKMFRQELTETAIHKLEKRKKKESERNDILEGPAQERRLTKEGERDSDSGSNTGNAKKSEPVGMGNAYEMDERRASKDMDTGISRPETAGESEGPGYGETR
ncbi:hypothetical protein K490DRAFT_38629 [Saccharata proteae CBS 121410]|uniref:Integral membrane protein n=1 Tax=Saccharata proteae CBS 121410 TaxID=1314787 RepID=A0A6A5YAX4_9PEZI|nr:hypothetical protein K490DRAFT_38629 [Saccharata proteae CBS 121410]